MEKKTLKFEYTKVTHSFADALNEWRDGTGELTYHEYMTCFSFLAFCVVQDIVGSTGMVVKEMKDEVLKDMHAYLQRAGDSALEELLTEIREREKQADGAAADMADAEDSGEELAAEEVSAEDAYADELALMDTSDEGSETDNGYFEKFEDD